jgi:hypothetical protein
VLGLTGALGTATVPSAPVSPSRAAITSATSTGVAVISQTRCPASRCIIARASVPGQIRSEISSSKTSSPTARISETEWPCTNERASSRIDSTCSRFSPNAENQNACQAQPARSRIVKNWRRYRPRASWKIEAPRMIVLSTSKNAAAAGSGTTAGGTSSGDSSRASASPASTMPPL